MVSDDVDELDMALFREAVGPVHPVRQDRQIVQSSKPQPLPSQRVADERQVLQEMAQGLADPEFLETGEELYFKRDGIQDGLFRKLKRGQFRIEEELDLHGMTIAVAKQALCDFLARARTGNRRCIRIIHGKGKGSKEGVPVLKGKLNKWLRQRDEIWAFCSARPAHGGTGAIYVLLKKQRKH